MGRRRIERFVRANGRFRNHYVYINVHTLAQMVHERKAVECWKVLSVKEFEGKRNKVAAVGCGQGPALLFVAIPTSKQMCIRC